jgi:hypothetical protein
MSCDRRCFEVGSKHYDYDDCQTCQGRDDINIESVDDMSLVASCKKLLVEWERRETAEHESGSAYHIGIGTGYGICREELRQVIDGGK